MENDVPESSKETAEQVPAPDPSQRPSLAERLMSLESTPPSGPRPPTSGTPRQGESRSSGSSPIPERPLPQHDRSARFGSGPRISPAIVDDAFSETRRYIRLRYFVFLASILVVFIVTVIVGVAFIVSLLNSSDWERIGISGGVLAVAVILLILMQYRPARSFALAASQLAQLEAAQTQMNRSFTFWERFVQDRQASHELTAQDVATAVSSLTSAASSLMNTQSELDVALAGSRTTQAPTQESRNGPRLPTSAAPDPRRF